MEEKPTKLPEVEAIFFSGAVYLVDAGAVTHATLPKPVPRRPFPSLTLSCTS
jgi:hypothetical protein